MAVLELLMTAKEYQGRGAGSLMLRYGCDMADRDGLETYVDSTPHGFPIYQKYGFVLKREEEMPGGLDYIERSLVRPPKPAGDN
jgi:GNAT superfamily N-acetyltransferase